MDVSNLLMFLRKRNAVSNQTLYFFFFFFFISGFEMKGFNLLKEMSLVEIRFLSSLCELKSNKISVHLNLIFMNLNSKLLACHFQQSSSTQALFCLTSPHLQG